MTTMSSGSTNSCPGIGRRRFGSPPERPTSRECPARGPYRTVTIAVTSYCERDRPHRKPSGDWSRHSGSHKHCATLLDTVRYQRSSGAAEPPGRRPPFGRRLILMGVWRDPSCVRSHELKKRARFEHGRWKKRMRIWQLELPEKSAVHLDDRTE